MERRQQVIDEVFGLYERFGDCDYIGGHPWQTVAISAGFGLVVGLLLGRPAWPKAPWLMPCWRGRQ